MVRSELLVGLVLLAGVSCTRQFLPETSPEPEEIVFLASFGGNPTRTALQDDGRSVWWTTGESINVFRGKKASGKFTSTNAAPGPQAYFSGTFTGNANSGSYWAVYPYGASNSCDGSSVTLSLPSDQPAAEDTFADRFFPCVASSGDNNLHFFNVCGGIRFRVSGSGIGSATFESVDGEPLAGTVKVAFSGGVPYIKSISGGVSSVSVSAPAGGFVPGRWYFATLLPGTYSGGLRLTFRRGDEYAVSTSSGSITIDRSKYGSLDSVDSGLEFAMSGKLCRSEYLGERPMVCAYLTEYTSSSTLDAAHLTHINYAHGRFANPSTGDGGIVISGTDLLAKVIALKSKKPGLKVLLMIGGWGEKADGFSMMARDAAKRTEFCQSCKSHIDNYGLDGIDIDWEYPTYPARGNGASEDDPANFNLVLKELRETIGDTKIISFASSASAQYVDWAGAMEYLDYVNVMTYDMGNPPYHNSTLYRSSLTKSRSCEESIEAHRKKGISLDRLVLGVPFYGHGIDPYDSDVKFNAIAGILANTSGKYTGKNIRMWDDVAKVPYLVDTSGTMLLGYDDAESVAWKGRFAVEKGLAGVMFWEYRHDDSSGTLRKALWGAVKGE